MNIPVDALDRLAARRAFLKARKRTAGGKAPDDAFQMSTFLHALGAWWDFTAESAGAVPGGGITDLNTNRSSNLTATVLTDAPTLATASGVVKLVCNTNSPNTAGLDLAGTFEDLITSVDVVTVMFGRVEYIDTTGNGYVAGKVGGSGEDGIMLGRSTAEHHCNIKLEGTNYQSDAETDTIISDTEQNVIFEFNNLTKQTSIWVDGDAQTLDATDDGDFTGADMNVYDDETENWYLGGRNLTGTGINSGANFRIASFVIDGKAWTAQNRIDVMANAHSQAT